MMRLFTLCRLTHLRVVVLFAVLAPETCMMSGTPQRGAERKRPPRTLLWTPLAETATRTQWPGKLGTPPRTWIPLAAAAAAAVAAPLAAVAVVCEPAAEDADSTPHFLFLWARMRMRTGRVRLRSCFDESGGEKWSVGPGFWRTLDCSCTSFLFLTFLTYFWDNEI